MGSQVPQGGDRTRTNWTPMMEQYFIDLMLDQMHRGNRMGHTFNKQAWADMLTMFNAKFGTKYDRDILKSHYTNLWKQYNDVKNLLEQNGFSWDDTQKMVIADDDVWDAFIKVHPDAQFYKRKSLMNFNDLCLIYAYTTADGRYSRSSHDVDIDDDIQGLSIGGIAPVGSERVKTDWTPAMDRYFVELMLDQLKKGHKMDKTFSKQAWKDMLTLFNAKFCSQYGKTFLKRRYKKLFKYYSDIRSLLERKGFSWYERQQMIVAEDAAWEKIIKAHPGAHSYRKKTLLNYRELNLIYGNEVVNGHLDLDQDKNFEDDTTQVRPCEEKDVNFSVLSNGFGPCWTPAMDHYFVDLLQDQALRGNKIGLELTTEAWIEMIKLFNERFGSHYEKEILKNRYIHLRRQYNVVNFLLEQNGFSWDENQEIVTAEDYVWDSFVKVHPDVRSHRNKTVPSYHKLCVIFGEEISKGRYSLSTHNVDLDSNGPAFMIGEDVQCYTNGDCARADWTPPMFRYFIDLLLDKVIRGNKIDDALDNHTWIDMAMLFKEKFELKLDKNVLKYYHKSLGRLFNDMKNLLTQRGFSWDESQQLVTAYNDVWDAYAKGNPDAVSYGTDCKPNYNDLFLIYGNSASDGGGGDQSCPGTKPNNSCCRRTDWTPPMDRYFIDLMIEHVHHGSMVNLRFNRQAWSDMAAKMSAEFGFQHDKDVLKCHFMDLMKRFNGMKSLLDQEGFAWDELRQMIIADDDLWNSYLKENPDAWSYRNRTLPNYNDLFLIFGDANNNGRLSYSCHAMAADEYILGPNFGDEDGLSPSDFDHSQINWTKTMEVYFIELLLEQVIKGNKIGQTFNEHAWSWIIASFNEKFGLLCDRDAVESWYFSLMEEYDNITVLLNQNGFYWDETERTIIADDDYWLSYIQEHPHANMGLYGINGDANQTEEFETSDRRKKRKLVTSSTSVASRKVQRQKMEDSKALGRKLHMVKTMGSKEAKEHMSIEVIVDALQAIPDMDDELFLEACQLLENEKKAKVFVGMDVNQRRKWLFTKLHR
ncbi:uncharacterized protein LOC110620451 isoform X3 [Manihot esculenta]|uniref:uncharacterized protein LOC110620451 isoform X3 n=1 Tax=Manihot esculenta TaxID=3983 RepID=UPI000B5D3116|nr:uncharacterized protein LOC110620451 isoform X3 [Manihot esculenta]